LIIASKQTATSLVAIVVLTLLSTMGRSLAWNQEETLLLAQAYIAASEDGSVKEGSGQKSHVIWGKVMEEFEKRAPSEASKVIGRYHNRGMKAVRSRFLDTVQPDVLHFNRALLVVLRSKPTGCTDQQKVNMAVAIHLGKVERREYAYKDLDPYDWQNYGAWCVLKRHPKFLPPTPAPSGDDADDEEEAEANETANEVSNESEDFGNNTESDDNNAATKHTNSFSIMSKRSSRSRGSGKGRKKAKEDDEEKRHKVRKLEALEGLRAIQEKRLKLQEDYVNNQRDYQHIMMLRTALDLDDSPEGRAYLRNEINKLVLASDKTAGNSNKNDDENDDDDDSAVEVEVCETTQHNELVDIGDGISVPAHLLNRED
jgi:hypothetical protein